MHSLSCILLQEVALLQNLLLTNDLGHLALVCMIGQWKKIQKEMQKDNIACYSVFAIHLRDGSTVICAIQIKIIHSLSP